MASSHGLTPSDHFHEPCPFAGPQGGCHHVQRWKASRAGYGEWISGIEIRGHMDAAHKAPINFYDVGPCAARFASVQGGLLPCPSCRRHIRAHASDAPAAPGMKIIYLQRHYLAAGSRTSCSGGGRPLGLRKTLILASQIAVDAGALAAPHLAGTYEPWEAACQAAEAAATSSTPFCLRPSDDPWLLDRLFQLLPGPLVAPMGRVAPVAPDLTAITGGSYGGAGAPIEHGDAALRALPASATTAGHTSRTLTPAAHDESAAVSLAAKRTVSAPAAAAAASGSSGVTLPQTHFRRGRSGLGLLTEPADTLVSPGRHARRQAARLAAIAATAAAPQASRQPAAAPPPGSGPLPSLADAAAALRAGSEAALAALGAEHDGDGDGAYADSARAAEAEDREQLREELSLQRLIPNPHILTAGEVGAAGLDVNGNPPTRDSPPASPAPSRAASPPPPLESLDAPSAGAGAEPRRRGSDSGGDGNDGDGDDDESDGSSDNDDAAPALPPSAGYPKMELGGDGIPLHFEQGHLANMASWRASVVETIRDINKAFRGGASGTPDYPTAASTFKQLLALAPTYASRFDKSRIAIMGSGYFANYVGSSHVNPDLPDTGPPPPAAPPDAGARAATIQAKIRAASALLAASRYSDASKMLATGPGPRHDFSTKHGQDAINSLHPRQEDGGFPSAGDLDLPPSPFGDDCRIDPLTMAIDDDTMRHLKIDLSEYDPVVDGEGSFVGALALAICPALAKLLAGHKASSAGGLDGWSYKAVLAAFRPPDDPASATRQSHLAPLAELLLHILSGKTGKGHFRYFYSELRGCALRKPNGKPRPLGIPSLFIRLAHALGLRLFRPAWTAATDAQDLGLKPAGCEALARTIQMTLNAGGAVHTTDASNAFNNINAQAVLNVGRAVPPLGPCINALYGEEHAILYVGYLGAIDYKIGDANRGVVAGDPLGTVAYNIASSAALADPRAAAAEKGCTILSVHDDLYVVSPRGAEVAFEVMRGHVEPAGAAIGVRQNREKTFLVTNTADAAAFAETSMRAAAYGVTLKSDGTVAGGIPVGTTAFILDHLDTASGEVVNYINQILVYARTTGAVPDPAALPGLAAGPGPKGGLQRIFTLLRMTAAPRFAHLLRGVDPVLTRLAAAKIDQAVFDAVMELLGHAAGTLPPVGSERYQAIFARVFLPVSMGGLGFVSLEGSRIPAYVASCQATAHLIHNGGSAAGVNFIDGSDIRDKVPGLRAACDALASPLYGGGRPGALAAKLEWRSIDKEAAHPCAEGLQARLTRPYDQARLDRLISAAPPYEKVALLSARDHHSGAFLHPSGGNQLLLMTDEDFRIAVNLRLGLDVVSAGAGGGPPAVTRDCPSCGRAMNARGMHAFTSGCSSSRGVAPSTHAAVTSAIRTVIARAPTGRIGFVGRGKEGTPLCDLPGWEPTPEGAAAAAKVDAAIAAAPPGAFPPHHECTRADVVISLLDPDGAGERTLVIDATITAGVQIVQANGTPIPDALLSGSGAAAADAETRKTANYKKFWKFQKNAFLALGFEVLGAASPNVATFIECVSLAAHPGIGPSKSDYDGKRAAFVSMMRQLISVRLQTANAAAVKRWRDACWNKAVPAPAAGAAAP